MEVNIPGIGEITLHARPAGSIYRAWLDEDEKPDFELVDEDPMEPSRGLDVTQ